MKQDDLTENDLQCLKMGRAVMLTGLRLATDILAEQIAIVEGQLHAAANGHDDGKIKMSMQRTMAKIGHPLPELPAPVVKRKRAASGYWAKMTPEERKAEMSRRYQMRGKKKSRKRLVQPNHPRNADHPKHAEWLVKMRVANRASWDRMTPAKRRARAQAAVTARVAKQKPKVKMEQS
jgi:hypothetical protein